MRIIKFGIAAICAVLTPFFSAEAAINGIDLENCRYTNGNIINPPMCEKLRLSDQRDMERKEKRRAVEAAQDEIRRQNYAQRESEKALAAEQNRVAAEQRARDDVERQALQKKEDKRWKAEREQEDRQELARGKRQAADLKIRKQACGNDFASPKIGMTLERVQQCVGKFKLSSQVNRADGVLSTYNSGSTYLHVMQGTIVGWGRY